MKLLPLTLFWQWYICVEKACLWRNKPIYSICISCIAVTGLINANHCCGEMCYDVSSRNWKCRLFFLSILQTLGNFFVSCLVMKLREIASNRSRMKASTAHQCGLKRKDLLFPFEVSALILIVHSTLLITLNLKGNLGDSWHHLLVEKIYKTFKVIKETGIKDKSSQKLELFRKFLEVLLCLCQCSQYQEKYVLNKNTLFVDFHIWEIGFVFRGPFYIVLDLISGQRQSFVFPNNDDIKHLKISKWQKKCNSIECSEFLPRPLLMIC